MGRERNIKKSIGLRNKKSFLLVVFLLTFIGFVSQKAYAVLILPKWLIIADNQRAARVILYNGADYAKVITFEWERRAINSNGEFVKLKEGEKIEGYRPADPYIKFSPRKVILQPGQNQKVRMIVQRPADLEPGEYHSHFAVHSERLSKAQQQAEQKREGLKGVLEVNVSTSIPVFLRHGETKADYSITNATLLNDNGSYFVDFNIENKSTRSLYGKVDLECIKNSGELVLETLRGIRLYVESKTINKQMPIQQIDVQECGSLKLKIYGKADKEYMNQVLSEYNLRLF